jgi:hypothetical protein
MRNIVFILIAFALFTFSATAQDIPKYLEGATVTVTLKNGKKFEYKSSKMAVVPRDNLGINALKAIHFDVLHEKLVKKELIKNKKNRIYGLAGIGPTGGLRTSTDGSRYKTSHKTGSVMGIGLQRKVDEEINIGIQIQNNDTTSLSLGLDF